MRRRVLSRAAAAMAAVIFSAPLMGQVDHRLTDRLAGPVADSVAAEIDAARTAGLPTEPLVQRALEGASRGADGPRIVAAVRALRLRLETAAAILPDTGGESALVAAAAALGAGVSESDVRTVVSESRKWGPPVAPLVFVADLVGRGVAADSAVWAVRALGEAGVPTSAWAVLPLQLDQDIAGGASPSAAAATRVRGLILSRDPGASPPEPGLAPRDHQSRALESLYRRPGLSTFVAPRLEIPLGPGSDTRLWSGLVAGAGTSRSHLGGELSAARQVGDALSLTLGAGGMGGWDQPPDRSWSSRALTLGARAGGDGAGSRPWLALDWALRDARWEGGEGSSGGGALSAGLRAGGLRLSGRAFGVAGSTSQVFRRDTVFTAGEYRFTSRRSIRRIGDWAELGGELSLGLALGPATVTGTVGQVWSDVPGMPEHRSVAGLSAALPLPRGLELETAAGWGVVDPLLGRTPGTFVTAGIRWTGSTRTPELDLPPVESEGGRPAARQRVTVEPSREGWVLTLHGVEADGVELMGDPTDWLPVPLEPLGGERWRLDLGPVSGVQRVLVRSDGGPWGPPAGAPLGSRDYDPPPGLVVVP